MSTAIKHPVPDRVKPSFVIFDIRALWRSALSVRVPGCQTLQMTSGHSDAQPWASECPDVKHYKWRLNPVWHRMLYSCGNSGRQRVKVPFCTGCYNHINALSNRTGTVGPNWLTMARIAGMIIYLSYGVWHSNERRLNKTPVIMYDVSDKDMIIDDASRWWTTLRQALLRSTSEKCLRSWRHHRCVSTEAIHENRALCDKFLQFGTVLVNSKQQINFRQEFLDHQNLGKVLLQSTIQ